MTAQVWYGVRIDYYRYVDWLVKSAKQFPQWRVRVAVWLKEPYDGVPDISAISDLSASGEKTGRQLDHE
jgi:hypothetical protein